MWGKHDRSFPTRKHDGNASRPRKTRSPCFRRAETLDGYKQLPVSVEFTKYGNTLFRPAGLWFFSPLPSQGRIWAFYSYRHSSLSISQPVPLSVETQNHYYTPDHVRWLLLSLLSSSKSFASFSAIWI